MLTWEVSGLGIFRSHRLRLWYSLKHVAELKLVAKHWATPPFAWLRGGKGSTLCRKHGLGGKWDGFLRRRRPVPRWPWSSFPGVFLFNSDLRFVTGVLLVALRSGVPVRLRSKQQLLLWWLSSLGAQVQSSQMPKNLPLSTGLLKDLSL